MKKTPDNTNSGAEEMREETFWTPPAAGHVAPQGFTWWTDVDMAPVDWAWTGMIPMGAMSLIMGAPGTTKSSMAAWIAAQFSKGKLDGDFKGTKSTVVWLSREDSARINLAPKLAVAKAGDVMLLDEWEPANINVTSPAGVKNLTALIEHHDVKMIIVDPLMAFTDSKFSQQTNTPAVIQMLSPLAALCATKNIALIGIVHTAKGKTAASIDSIAGSQGFTSTSRHVLVIGRKGRTYLIAPVKSNVARVGFGHTYGVEYVEAAHSTNTLTGVTKPITASKITLGRVCIPSEVEACLKADAASDISPYFRPILEALNETGAPTDTGALHRRLTDEGVLDVQVRQFTNVLAELRDLGYITEDYSGFGRDKQRLVWITRSGRTFINNDVDLLDGVKLPRTISQIIDQGDDDDND